MTWCGYIDLLGTRALAERSADDMLQAVSNFHSALQEASGSFTGRCIAISDGAFLQAEDLGDLLNFCRKARGILFQNGEYFRCAIIPEKMIDRSWPETLPPDARIESLRFFSLYFGKGAATAYQEESRFKGVGCVLSIKESESRSDVVPSFYLRRLGRTYAPVHYKDLRYDPFELSKPDDPSRPKEQFCLGPKVLEALHIALAQSNEVAARYCSILVAMVRSCDLTAAEADDKIIVNIPYIFKILTNRRAIRSIRTMPGLPLLLLSCFDHLFTAKGGTMGQPLELLILERLQTVPACFRQLDDVPDFVIGKEARQCLVKLKARYAGATIG